MERRVLLAIFLAFLVLYGWQALFVKPAPKPAGTNATPPSTGVATPGTTVTQPASPAPTPPSATSENTATGSAASAPAAAPLVADTTEHEVRVETRDVIAVFTNRGARLKSWRLKHYLNQEKQPQELVEHEVSTQPLPFTLRTANDAVDATLNGALYTVAGAPLTPADAAPIDLRFEYRDSAGVHAVKVFHLDPTSYI